MMGRRSQKVAGIAGNGRATKGDGSVDLVLSGDFGVGAAGRRKAARPIYQQIKEQLIRRVLAGEWRPGECIPSEQKLAGEYGVSQGTVRRAIEDLAADRLVTRHAGRGTFVTSHQGGYQPFRFHRLYDDAGTRVIGNEQVYVSCRKGKASPRAARGLQIEPKAPVTEIVRLRRLDGRPILLQSIVLRADLCPDAHLRLARDRPNSLYVVLEEAYNLLIVRVDERLRARVATSEEAQLLELATGAPVLEVERVAYGLSGKPVEWRIALYNTGDLYYWYESDE
jgi:GntR family transcriptional regulator